MRTSLIARRLAMALALSTVLAPVVASAGPPFLTDDPEPVDTGHWEIYGLQVEAEGTGKDYEGAAGVEINYGAAPDLQVSVAIPMAFTRSAGETRTGAGDLELSAKYRFYHDEQAGVSIAFFPGLTLPTATKHLGAGRVTGLLPVWAQKDIGPWSIFGGGGYAINPGADNQDYWTGGLAVTREIGPGTLLGIEADRQGPDAVGARAETSLGFGAIQKLGGPFRILASGGPTFIDGSRKAGFHAFVAIGADF